MQRNNKQAPLPPNGTKNRYWLELCATGEVLRYGYTMRTKDSARECVEILADQGYAVRIVARLSDGRKLVLP